MKKLKAPILFTLPLLPIAAVAGYFAILYQLDFMDAATVELTVSQLGSVEALIVVYIVQIVGYTVVCGVVGHILAGKLGLLKPVKLEKALLVRTLVLAILGGILFSLDYWTFGAWIPGVQEATDGTLNFHVIMASVLYGGIIEELMLRWFFMSLIAWLLWKLFFRKAQAVPTLVLVAANLLSALLFAAEHLPATQMLFGTLTPLILIRCFLLNSGAGLLFGWLYRKYGIQYAMVAHACFHIVSKLIWAIAL